MKKTTRGWISHSIILIAISCILTSSIGFADILQKYDGSFQVAGRTANSTVKPTTSSKPAAAPAKPSPAPTRSVAPAPKPSAPAPSVKSTNSWSLPTSTSTAPKSVPVPKSAAPPVKAVNSWGLSKPAAVGIIGAAEAAKAEQEKEKKSAPPVSGDRTKSAPAVSAIDSMLKKQNNGEISVPTKVPVAIKKAPTQESNTTYKPIPDNYSGNTFTGSVSGKDVVIVRDRDHGDNWGYYDSSNHWVDYAIGMSIANSLSQPKTQVVYVNDTPATVTTTNQPAQQNGGGGGAGIIVVVVLLVIVVAAIFAFKVFG